VLSSWRAEQVVCQLGPTPASGCACCMHEHVVPSSRAPGLQLLVHSCTMPCSTLARRRWLRVLGEGMPWEPSRHALYPPRFQAATRALLLANSRGFPGLGPTTDQPATPLGSAFGTGAADGSCSVQHGRPLWQKRQRGQGQRQRGQRGVQAAASGHWAAGGRPRLGVTLPPEVLELVLRHAASSLSSWLPPLPPMRLADLMQEVGVDPLQCSALLACDMRKC